MMIHNNTRAVRHDNIYRVTREKCLSFHILLYRLYRCDANYTFYGNIFGHLESTREAFIALIVT